MGKFCTKCGTALNESAKFCAKCGANAFHSNESAQISTESPTQSAKSEQEISKTINSRKKKPPINRASEDAPQHSPMGAGKFIIAYIRQSLTVLKNPKQMLPTALLGFVWWHIRCCWRNFRQGGCRRFSKRRHCAAVPEKSAVFGDRQRYQGLFRRACS